MVNKTLLIRPEDLVNLFAFFVLGTISFIVMGFSSTSAIIPEWVFTALSIIVIVTYEIVVVSLLLHYLTKGSTRLIVHFKTYKQRYYYLLVILVAVTIGIVNYFNDGNGWLRACSAILILLFSILILPLTNKIMAWYKKHFSEDSKR